MEVFFSHHMPRRSWSVSAVQCRHAPWSTTEATHHHLASLLSAPGRPWMVTALAELDQQTETETRPRFQGQQGYNAASTRRPGPGKSRAPGTHRFGGKGLFYLSRGVTSCQVPTRTAGFRASNPQAGMDGWIHLTADRNQNCCKATCRPLRKITF